MRLMLPTLVDGLVAADLRGRRRQALTVAPFMRGRRVALANTVYDGAIAFLQQQLELQDSVIDLIRAQYQQEADQILGQLELGLEHDILRTIQEGLRSGQPRRHTLVELGKVFKNNGIEPDSSWAVESIYRTETQKAYAAGRWAGLQQPAVQSILWGFRYVTAADSRVRPTHAVMDGITLPKDHSFWERQYPPNGWGCRCQAVELFGAQQVIEPESLQIGERLILPVADPGFAVNYGRIFGVQVAA